MSEYQAHNVASSRGTAQSNSRVSEEVNDRSRRIIEQIEGASGAGNCTASAGSDKPSDHLSQKGERRTETIDNYEKTGTQTIDHAYLFPEGEFVRDWLHESKASPMSSRSL
ncbi:hypothetical protein NM688_g1955 [Phlebia brevispora]|uniref:Uncharacterized protein n=1 Tax=Phlebia brevispora TaxID=194682 RepID=A0ACC1T9S2_9APHY|nr:hypothetical protein NM688_g1955 [Phlebia brevispora]